MVWTIVQHSAARVGDVGLQGAYEICSFLHIPGRAPDIKDVFRFDSSVKARAPTTYRGF